MFVDMKLRGFSLKKRLIKISCIIIILSLFCYWQNNYLQVSQYTYTHSKINNELDGFKIVQISDLHNKSFGNNQKRLLDEIEKCEPDIIVVTGDVIDANHTNLSKAMDFFEGAVKIAPVYYITGNHEYSVSSDIFSRLISGMEELGVCYLDNECVEIKEGEETLNLIGLNDTSLDNSVLEGIMKNVNTDNFSILLAHEPQYFSEYCNNDIELILSGHAHGGQIRLPFIGGLVAPGQGFLPRYTSGKYSEKNATMYVSRGLGNSVIPLRIFNFPEIVCIELKES